MDNLSEETGGGAGLFDAGGELLRAREMARGMGAREVVLGVGVEGGCVEDSWSGRALFVELV